MSSVWFVKNNNLFLHSDYEGDWMFDTVEAAYPFESLDEIKSRGWLKNTKYIAVEYSPRINTLREAAKMVCGRCADNEHLSEDYYHPTIPDHHRTFCEAANIHREIARLEAGNG